jgi:hypothetical protein
MDILQLPALPPLTPIKLAWSILQNAQRSALITTAAERPALVTAEDLALAENRGASTLEELQAFPVPTAEPPPVLRRITVAEDNEPASVLDALDLSVREHLLESRLGAPHHEIRFDPALQGAIDGMLAGIDVDFALIGLSPGAAILASRHESRLRAHAGPPRRCYCQNPNYVHGYDDKVTGDPCDLDAYTVSCRR